LGGLLLKYFHFDEKMKEGERPNIKFGKEYWHHTQER